MDVYKQSNSHIQRKVIQDLKLNPTGEIYFDVPMSYIVKVF